MAIVAIKRAGRDDFWGRRRLIADVWRRNGSIRPIIVGLLLVRKSLRRPWREVLFFCYETAPHELFRYVVTASRLS
jgi:hypothetical protein